MKRVALVFLLASPVWIASAGAGWWLGGGSFDQAEPRSPFAARKVLTPAAPSASTAVRPVAAQKQPLRVRPIVAAAKPAPAELHARQPATPTAAPPAPAAVLPPRPVPSAPPPPLPAEPIASLGSTDPLAPEKALAPASAETPVPSGGGVLIVVSLASQKAFVFKDGELWGSSPVSTGKRGKGTPAGRYTILEKQVHHRSRTYDNAPMPYMQRLTWGGVAMHAGHLPGYPASHGCIRMPRSFAKKLYNLTDFGSTTVVVTKKKARSSDEALKAA